MSTLRFFVSLDDQGRPLYQRNTVKAKPYLSASYEGNSFSSSPPNGAYPRKVIEVPKALQWVARATLADGSKVTERSVSAPIAAGIYVRYRYAANGETARKYTADDWSALTEAQWRAKHPKDDVLEVVASTVELRNWPVVQS